MKNATRRKYCSRERTWRHYVLLLLFITLPLIAQEPRRYAVELKVQVNRNPHEIKLLWRWDDAATEYSISRKDLGGSSWSEVAKVSGSVNDWTDRNVQAGMAYEYKVVKRTSVGYTGYGYTSAAIDRPPVDNRGKVLLLIEQSLATPLDFELKRYALDLVGDGWTVAQENVSASLTPPQVKAIITAEYNKEPKNLKAVVLLGHLPVPYSGDIAPDRHEPDHKGAWPADSYYADIDGTWTDNSVNSVTAERPVNRNVPGDGKFDQSFIPSAVELQVGRVDLSSLTCFANKTVARNEIDLMRQYFNKNHAFRNGRLPVQNKALIYNDVAMVPPEPAISYGWRTLTALLGTENIIPLGHNEFLPKTANDYYLWVAATSGGGWTYANATATADELAIHNVNVIFSFFCSSYFGDWNNESNFLRAVLGASGGPLTAAYGSRPTWLCHNMGVGETIGQATMITMDNKEGGGLYPPHLLGSGMVHTSLLGDPTLRMTPIPTPGKVSGRVEGGKLILSWEGSSAPSMARYYIYKAISQLGPYTKIGETDPSVRSFEVQNAGPRDVFQVRAINLTTGNNGSYYNASQGSFFANTTITVTVAPSEPKNAEAFPLSKSSIRVRWIATGSNQDGFIIQRKAATETSFYEIARVSFEKLEYVDGTLNSPNVYSYRVLAYNSAGVSVASNVATASNKVANFDFLGVDNTTKGNWKSKYGKLGYSVVLQQTNLPTSISMTFSNTYTATYGWYDDDVRLLTAPDGRTKQQAAWWVNGMPFGFDVGSNDDQTRAMSLYFMDWNYGGRRFNIQAFDVTTKTLLFDESIGNHTEGIYLQFLLKGRVFIKITPGVAYQTQLLLGIFFDSAPTISPPQITPNGGTFAGRVSVGMSTPMSGTQIRYTVDGSEPTESSALYSGPFILAASANVKAKSFKAGFAPSATTTAYFENSLSTSLVSLGIDSSTQGGWRGVYGSEGYLLPELGSVTPSYSDLRLQNVSTWVWLSSTSDSRGQIKPTSTDRMASTWFSPDVIQFDLDVLDTYMHSLAMYFLDWDNRGRRQLVEIFDVGGQLLHKTELSNFSNGVYLRYKIKGQIRCKITKLSGDNAVLNGMFFDEAPLDPVSSAPTQTFSKDANGLPVFTFFTQAGRTICVDVSQDCKNWGHTGNQVLSNGRLEIRVQKNPPNQHLFYRSHIVE